MIKVDYDSVAKTIVTTCMRVKPEETILISGGLYCWQLMEDIAVFITRQNAYYFFKPTTDRLMKKMLAESDMNFLEKPPKPEVELAKLVDGRINIDRLKDPRVLQEIPEKRIGARRKAFRTAADILLERKVRWTGMGYPTREKAEVFGIEYEEFHDIFWKAVTTDYGKMHQKGTKLADTLKDASHVRITTDRSDLEFSLVGRPIYIDDGVISKEDLESGDFGNNLPAGEVFCAPVEVSANGEAFFDVAFSKGQKITGINAVFKNGNLTSVSCEENEFLFKEVLANAHGKKDVIGEFGIGINPEITRATGYVLCDEKIVGSIHIALGENRGFGGENESSLHWDLVMMRPTVYVDSTLIIEEGSFLL